MKPFEKDVEWRKILPRSYDWIDSLNLQPTKQAPANTHSVVVAKNKPNEEGISIDAVGLAEDIKAELIEASSQLGRVSSGGVWSVVCRNTVFTLVNETSLDVSHKQKANQVGLDLASYFSRISVQSVIIYSTANYRGLQIWEGFAQGVYDLCGFKSEKESASKGSLLEHVYLYDDQLTKGDLYRAKAMAQALTVTRMVEDAPGNWLNPERFAEIAKDLASALEIKCGVHGRDKLAKLGMGAFLSVSNGSAIEPKMICMEIAGKDPSKTVVLVGKGLTFDAGGVCLKPAPGMDEMKYDMCGGAAVLGAASFLGKVQPSCNVVCLIGAVENLMGPEATKPGDIVTAMNGKSIEVLNTDAEGRLVLADLMCYANENWKPDLMIDVATLTGAVLVALGSCGAALMSNDQQAADKVLESAKNVGEPMWQMPIWPELPQEIKSDIADIKNITSPSVKAGSITAACFLKEFAGDTPWTHIDIAGTGWTCKSTGYPSKGGSGYAVRTLSQVCTSYAE